MTTQQPDYRWQEIRAIHWDYHFFYEMAVGVALVIIGIVVGFALFPNDIGYRGNLYTTILGVVITVVVLDRRAERREHQREEGELKARLIRELKSNVPEIARRAAEKIAEHEWHQDGTLAGKKLYKINVQDVEWYDADLHECQLGDANFSGTELTRSNLEGANLYWAILEHSYLMRANLRNANLEGCNLREAVFNQGKLYRANFNDAKLIESLLSHSDCTEANFRRADLSHAQFENTNLKNANLFQAKCLGTFLDGADLSGVNLLDARFDNEAYFNEQTILPDGTRWKKGTDMERFTDAEHPQFWRSDDPESPAHRDKGYPYWEERYDWWKEDE